MYSIQVCINLNVWISGLILGLCPANERWRYFVMTSLIGWANTRINPESDPGRIEHLYWQLSKCQLSLIIIRNMVLKCKQHKWLQNVMIKWNRPHISWLITIQPDCMQHHLTKWVNTLRPRQDGRHFPDDTFKWIFLNENVQILIKISLKYVPHGPINNILALVQIMAWRRPGDKPLSEPMVVSLLS